MSEKSIFDVEFTRRTHPRIVEVAEALGVKTDMVLTVLGEGQWLHVLYSPNEDDPQRIFGVKLRRDPDAVLRPVGEPEEIPGLWEEIERRMRGEDEAAGGPQS